MISKTSHNECFVYITLPGETSAVTAGRFLLTADRRGTPLGRFVYGQSYLKRSGAVDIDPVELRLGRGTFETTNLKGMFGVSGCEDPRLNGAVGFTRPGGWVF